MLGVKQPATSVLKMLTLTVASKSWLDLGSGSSTLSGRFPVGPDLLLSPC